MEKDELITVISARLYNLHHGLFAPQNKIYGKKQVIEIFETGFLNGKFIGIPVLVPTRLLDHARRNVKYPSNVRFGDPQFAQFDIEVDSIFDLDLKPLISKMLDTTDDLHPAFRQFLSLGSKFISGEILRVIETSESIQYAKQFNAIETNDRLAALASRNPPHHGHIRMVNYLYENDFSPMISTTVEPKKQSLNVKHSAAAYGWLLTSKKQEWPNFQHVTIFEKSYLAGPREACHQALVRKNLGASYFVVGRDHSGVDNYYGIYDSQVAASRLSKNIGIGIISYPGSVFCSECNKAITIGDCDHSAEQQSDISSSAIKGSQVKKDGGIS